MIPHLNVYRTLDPLIKHRKGEVKLGERMQFLSETDPGVIYERAQKGVRFALLGIPESIGVQANYGQAGTETAWDAFIKVFANVQSNRFLEAQEILCAGTVNVTDLQARAAELSNGDVQYYTKLRSLCQELDSRVSSVVEYLVKAKLIPVVIGGGHNNCFPLLRAVSQTLGYPQGIACLNCDAHADFRPLEGRHSGNGFSYAFYQGFLQRYYALGLHPQSNNEAMFKNMDLEPQVSYSLVDECTDMSAAVKEALNFIERSPLPCGLELDMDAISMMPASAMAVDGVSLKDARVYIKAATRALKPVYLHLPEAVAKTEAQKQVVGKSLTHLVADFMMEYPD